MGRQPSVHPNADLRVHPTLPGFRVARDLEDPALYWSFGQWERAWDDRKRYEITPEEFEALERVAARAGAVAAWPGSFAPVEVATRKRARLVPRNFRLTVLLTAGEGERVLERAERENKTASTLARDALLAALGVEAQ